MTQLNSRQFPEVYDTLGITIEDLGCIMLDVAPFTVTELVEGGENDLYYGTIPALRYAQGAVAEKSAHVTLLYGLLDFGGLHTKLVDSVLLGWSTPSVRIKEVSFFPSSNQGEDYSVIVGKIDVTPELLEGHHRLQLLPHIDTFPEYVPHLTLAYIKNNESGVKWVDTPKEKWVRTLNRKLAGKSFAVSCINYGGKK